MADLAHAAAAHAIAQEVLAERDRQDTKWGEQNHPDGTGPRVHSLSRLRHPGAEPHLDVTLASDLAQAAKVATDTAADEGVLSWSDILLEEVFEALAEDDLDKLRNELIQTAAVAQQWVQAIDRRRMDEIHADRAERRP